MQRTNGNTNTQDCDEFESESSASRAKIAKHSSNGRNQVDRHTSALNRRILPRHVDGRSAEAKRLMGLVRDLAEHVEDSDNPVTRARLVAAALLVMQQESMAHAVAAGKAVDPNDIVRIANACERALRRLK
jgi:hypothetical protein